MHVRVLLSRYREYALCTACRGSRLNATALRLPRRGARPRRVARAHRRARRARASRAYAARDPQGKRVKEQLASRLGVPRRRGPGVPHARPAGAHALGRRGAARGADDGARRGAHRDALRARRADRGPARDRRPARSRSVDAGPRARRATRCWSSSTSRRSCARATASSRWGPGAGPHGGRILFDGTPAALAKRTDLPTGQGVGRVARGAQRTRREREGVARGPRRARAQPARASTSTIPLGVVCAVTGPERLGQVDARARRPLPRGRARARRPLGRQAGAARRARGRRARSRAPSSSISRRSGAPRAATPPPTSKAWDRIRARFAAEPEAHAARARPPRTSRSTCPRGRCEECSGEGYETVEMQFLADVQLLCPVCQGKRFKPEVLAVTPPRQVRVADVLAMSVEEALARASIPPKRPRLRPAARARSASRRWGSAICRSGSRSRRCRAARRSA